MNSTTNLIQRVGIIPVAVALLLSLTVVLLRLAALPFAITAVALDGSATLAARPLSFPAMTNPKERE